MTSVADVLGWTDLLSNHSLKPWWETVRSVTLVVMTLISSLLLLSLSDSPISCFPDESKITYNTAQAKFVEKMCGFKTFYQLHTLLWVSVFATGLTFITHNYWMYRPTVGAAILRFSTAYSIHNELHVTLSSMKRAITTPNNLKTSEKGKERRNKLRQLCTLLVWFMNKDQRASNTQNRSSCARQESNVSETIPLRDVNTNSSAKGESKPVSTAFAKSYRCRNFLSLLLALAYVAVSVIAMILWFPKQNVFHCKRSDEVEYNYTCVYNGFIINFVATGMFAVSSVVQGVIFFRLLLIYWNTNDLQLLMSFAEKSSEKETWNTFNDWIDKLETRSNFLGETERKYKCFKKAIEEQDVDFFYFVNNTLDVDVAGTLKNGHFCSIENYEVIQPELEDMFGEEFPKPATGNAEQQGEAE